MGLGVASNWSLHVLLLVIGLQMMAVSSESKLMPSIFFRMESLNKGTTKPVYLPKREASNSHFLPRHEADSLPRLTSRNLREIMRTFAVRPGSAAAKSVEDTVMVCENPAIEGETKFCATSLESMLDFVLGVFGLSGDSGDDRPTLLASRFAAEPGSDYQNYTIVSEPEEVLAEKMVGCHALEYPHTVLYCHSQDGGNRVLKMRMRGQNGDLVDIYAACHLDTWNWNILNPAFATLGTRPGDPACHVFPPHGNFLWIHNNN